MVDRDARRPATFGQVEQQEIQRSTFAERHESGLWADENGALGPFRPGVGPRNDPAGWFPTGPEIGEVLPEIIAPSHAGEVVDVHRDRAGKPAVVVFYRSAVW